MMANTKPASIRRLVVAIDGPAGSGKSTVTRLVAKKLDYVHIDTGALYRAVALNALKKPVSIEDGAGLGEVAAASKLEFRHSSSDDSDHIFLDGVDVSNLIRTPEISMAASKISAYPEVRAALLGLQRELGAGGGVVLEGRDIGTVVFPEAEAKFFVTATVDERARRRQLELAEKGTVLSLDEVKKQVIDRDKGDSERAVAPLRKAPDAVEIDTTCLTIDQVVDKLCKIVRERENLTGKNNG